LRVEDANMSSKQELSGKALENLRKNEVFRNRASRWVKLDAEEEEILEFNAEDIQQIEVQYDGKKKPRFQYGVVNSIGNAQFFIACKKTSKIIDNYLSQGYKTLKIRRVGLGIDTEYMVSIA
jgi:hypothetical protein